MIDPDPPFKTDDVLDANGQPIDLSYFETEGCAVFALVLARRLKAAGLTADIAVLSNRNGEPFSEDHDFEFTHVLTSVANGYVDVRGQSPLREIAQRFDLFDFTLEGEWNADIFEALFVGFDDDKPLYGADDETTDWANRLIDAAPERYGFPSHADRLIEAARTNDPDQVRPRVAAADGRRANPSLRAGSPGHR